MIQYKRKSNFETAHLDDEWIILNIDRYTMTKLNETGGYCWSLLSEAQTVESLCQEMIIKYNQSCRVVKEDVEKFLVELYEYELIEHIV